MSDQGDTAKTKAQQSQTQLPQQQISSSPLVEESSDQPARPIHHHLHHHHHHQPQPATPVVVASPIISTPLYVSPGATVSSPFDSSTNPKRTRYTSGQWKLLPSPSSQQIPLLPPAESSPSPSQLQPQTQPRTSAASSSDTASSDPIQSPPVPSSLSPATGPEGSKSEGEQQIHHQFRKGKYVSPVWKPHEMLWLARAWRVQYQGGGYELGGSSSSRTEHVESGVQATRGKTRADKDREVAEFLQRHGVNRDAKTAGTKWDNMLGEFRKVYEWERGGERQHVGKSYFRLSPYERKVHRLPASFDEEVFEELSQFMGSRMRTSHARGAAASSSIVAGDDSRHRALPTPPPFKEDELPLSARTKQLGMTSGGEALFHGPRGMILGLEPPLEIAGPSLAAASSSKELRRIGKIRMTWEESVSLWAEEGELHRGRVRLQNSSFLKADELSFFDDSMVLCTMECFEDGPFKGFSVDRFVSGQQVKVFGRRKYSPSASASASGFPERVQPSYSEPLIRSTPPWEFQDPTEYYMGCLRVSPQSLPTLYELSWHVQEPPMEELRFPLRKDVYKDLPLGKELFFTASSEPLDCRAIMYDIVSPIIRPNPSLTHATSSTRESLISLWDDCINRVVSKFCPLEMLVTRKPTSLGNSTDLLLQDQWPNVTGFVRNYCLWRGEETDQVKEGQLDPSSTIAEKLLWTYLDLPYILGYYAVGHVVTFCALSRSQDRITRTDLYTLDLSSPTERIKALVPCYRIGLLLPLLAERCFHMNSCGNYKLFAYSDFERVDLGNGNLIEMTPITCTRIFQSKRKWVAVKEIYEILDHRIPHAEFIFRSCEKDLSLVFKPRGCKMKPENCEQLVEALKYVTKALVALHDLSFMHRDLGWDKVMRRCDRENEWFVCGFDEAVGAPQLYPYMVAGGEGARGRHAPEMGRGLHTVKVDVWGVGYLIKTSGLSVVPKMLRELQNRCMEQNAEQRPTAADCYHHLLQLQSSLSGAAGGGLM